MALYLGKEKLKVNLNGALYYLNVGSRIPVINVIRLLSSDCYVLKGSNGLYLVPKEEK